MAMPRVFLMLSLAAVMAGCASAQSARQTNVNPAAQHAMQVENGNWLIVHGDVEADAVMRNVERLATDLARITSGMVTVMPASSLSDQAQTANSLILVGECESNAFAREVLDGHGRGNPFATDVEFARQQGYVVDVYPGHYAPDRKVMVAVGWGPPGALYAVSHLRAHLLAQTGRVYLDVEGAPQSRHEFQITQRPNLEERGIYYYLATEYNYPPLTPVSWDEGDWDHWIDKAVCAQFTHILFCLWGGTEYLFLGSPACYNETNRRMHERLRHMIDEAHRRGLKVTCLLSPTFIPTDIVDANHERLPYLRAGGHYGDALKTICQAEPGTIVMGDRKWDGAMALIADVMNCELDWFERSDSFQIWFYDPGGCYCGPERHNCKALQDERLMEQVRLMTDLVWQRNPQAGIEVHLWPTWLLEGKDYIGWDYREPFLDRLKTYFSGMNKMDRITVCDVLDWPGVRPPYGSGSTGLLTARDKGLRTNGFIYSTGYEDGYCFLNPSFALLGWEAATAKESHIPAAYMYRYEEGSKFPTTFFFSRTMWNLNTLPMQALRQYVNWIANTDHEAADRLFEAFILIDEFTCEGTAGQDHEAKGARIRELVEQAIDELPAWKRIELEWLLTTARAFAILGKAVEHRDDPAAMDALARDLIALTKDSPSFKGFSSRILDDRGEPGTRFDEHVGWLARGWYAGAF
jgi:hypothetical protein